MSILQELREKRDDVRSQETQFVIDTINRLGGSYFWDGDDDGQKPLIPANPYNAPEDITVSSAIVTNGFLRLTGKDKDGNEFEFDSSNVYIGWLHYIIDYLPCDEEESESNNNLD